MFSVLSLHSENRGERLGKFESRSVVSPARKFSQTFLRFSPGYEGTDYMFCFLYNIIIFRLNKEKDFIQSVYVYLNFFHETFNSHNLETAKPHCSRHFRASQPYENTFVDQSKRACYPNYSIRHIKVCFRINLFWLFKHLYKIIRAF